MGQVIMITGGARSGKSSYAERLARQHRGAVGYVATAEAKDDEMAARISAHRAPRPAEWLTIEEPLDLRGAVARAFARCDFVLVDCLALWVSNRLLERSPVQPLLPVGEGEGVPGPSSHTLEATLLAEISTLLDARQARPGTLVLVTNEVGLGIVPEYPLARLYRDLLGRVNQAVAAQADSVYLLISGLAVDVKKLSEEIGREWPEGVSASDAVSADRREL